jgi:hypothetical protein
LCSPTDWRSVIFSVSTGIVFFLLTFYLVGNNRVHQNSVNSFYSPEACYVRSRCAQQGPLTAGERRKTAAPADNGYGEETYHRNANRN